MSTHSGVKQHKATFTVIHNAPSDHISESESTCTRKNGQQAIGTMVSQRGRMSVAALSETFGVTTETVRRDLAFLERIGQIRRVHGGAVPTGSLHVTEPGMAERDQTRAQQKDRIARCAVTYLPPTGGSVIFDAGTTTGRMIPELPTENDFTAVTNSVPIGARLASMNSISLILLGGRVRGVTQAAVGEDALRLLSTLRVDVAFVGTNAISVGHGLSTPDSEEAAVKRAMVKAANHVVVVADSSKVGREHLISFAPHRQHRRPHHRRRDQSHRHIRVPRPRNRGGDRMIVTLTANPSIDRTVQLEQRLERGSVLRAHSTRSDPGGKGVNVARVLAAADLDVLAVLPGNGGDPLLSALATGGIPHIGVATTGPGSHQHTPSRNRTGPRRRSTNRAQRCPVRRSTPWHRS